VVAWVKDPIQLGRRVRFVKLRLALVVYGISIPGWIRLYMALEPPGEMQDGSIDDDC